MHAVHGVVVRGAKWSRIQNEKFLTSWQLKFRENDFKSFS